MKPVHCLDAVWVIVIGWDDVRDAGRACVIPKPGAVLAEGVSDDGVRFPVTVSTHIAQPGGIKGEAIFVAIWSIDHNYGGRGNIRPPKWSGIGGRQDGIGWEKPAPSDLRDETTPLSRAKRRRRYPPGYFCSRFYIGDCDEGIRRKPNCGRASSSAHRTQAIASLVMTPFQDPPLGYWPWNGSSIQGWRCYTIVIIGKYANAVRNQASRVCVRLSSNTILSPFIASEVQAGDGSRSPSSTAPERGGNRGHVLLFRGRW